MGGSEAPLIHHELREHRCALCRGFSSQRPAVRPREPTTARLQYRLRRGSLPRVWTSSDSIPRECLISRRWGVLQPSRLEAAFRSDSKDGADSRKRDPPAAYIIAVMLAVHVDASEDGVPLSTDLLKSLEGLQGLRDVHRVRLEAVARAGHRAFARSPPIIRSHSTTFPAWGTKLAGLSSAMDRLLTRNRLGAGHGSSYLHKEVVSWLDLRGSYIISGFFPLPIRNA